jgi:hypothetical protein
MEISRREARLRQQFATLYAGVPPEEWRPIRVVLDCVAAARLLGGRRSGEMLAGRPLDDRHFEFRGGSARRGTPDRTRVTDH